MSGSGARGSGRSGPGRPRVEPPSNRPLIIGGAAALVGVIAVVWMMSAGGGVAAGSGSGEKDTTNTTAPVTPPASTATPPPSSPSKSYGPSEGKAPGRAAPPIASSTWTEIEALYDAAKAKWNDGMRARKVGDNATFATVMKEAWASIVAIKDKIEPQTDWFEEADLSGWRMPADYVRLGDWLKKFDTLRSKVQKVKPI